MSQPTMPAVKPFHRPLGVAILSILIILSGVIVLLVGIAMVLALGIIGTMVGGPVGGAFGAALGFVVLIVGGITLVAGLGLWRMQGWAWWLAMLVLVLQLVVGFGGWIIPLIMIVYLLLVRKHFNQ